MTTEQKGSLQPQIGVLTNVDIAPPASGMARWMNVHIRRRGVISHGVVAGASTAIGMGVGKELYRQEQSKLEVTDEPLDVQIRKLEQRAGQEGLRNQKLRSHYTWLVAQWYGQKFSLGAFHDENDEFAAATKIYTSIISIESENDPRLVGFEGAAGWTVPGESISMNLTTSQIQESYSTSRSGATITPLMAYRDTLVHEITHFITEPREEAIAIDLIKAANPQFKEMKAAKLSGFRIYFDPDPDNPDLPIVQHMADFDEAATEFIANYEQRISGLATGLPTYPEGDFDEFNQTHIERTIDTLDATIKLAGIKPEVFMIYHKLSDLDGLAKNFAEATSISFATEEVKVEYGLGIINAIRNIDRTALGEFVKRIKA